MIKEELFSNTSKLSLMLEDLDSLTKLKEDLTENEFSYNTLTYETINTSIELVVKRWGLHHNSCNVTLESFCSSYITPNIKRTIVLENLSTVVGLISEEFFSKLASTWKSIKVYLRENFSRLKYNQGVLKSFSKKIRKTDPATLLLTSSFDSPSDVSKVYGCFANKISSLIIKNQTERIGYVYEEIANALMGLIKTSDDIYNTDDIDKQLVIKTDDGLSKAIEKIKNLEGEKGALGTEDVPLPTGIWFSIDINDKPKYPIFKLKKQRVEKAPGINYLCIPPRSSDVDSIVKISLVVIDFINDVTKDLDRVEDSVTKAAKGISKQFKFNKKNKNEKEAEVQKELVAMYRSLLSISNLYINVSSSVFSIVGQITKANISYLKKSLSGN